MEANDKEYSLLKAKPRCKKLKPRIDLASMVSVSFLLIIFFMVTQDLAKPRAMDFGVPERYCGEGRIGCCFKPDEKRILTLLLDDDNKVISYWGLAEVPNEQPKKLGYGKNGIRKELIAKNKIIEEYMAGRNTRYKEGTIVIIKPSRKSNYGNLVDILDEMRITNIQNYAVINDFSPEEQRLLASR